MRSPSVSGPARPANLQTFWTRVARLAELEGPGPFGATVGAVELVLVRTPTGFHAYEGRCPHQGALLAEGQVDGSELVCRNHGWRFDVASGQHRGGAECLIACPTEVRGHDLWADLAALVHARESRATVSRRQIKDLPGPPSRPVVGNLHQLDKRQLHRFLEQWAAQYGPLFRYRMGPKQVVAVADATLSERVLRERPETYRRASSIEPVFRELGLAGVFSAEGSVWRPQRKLAMHALSVRQLRAFYPTLQVIARRLETRWRRKADHGLELDFIDELKRFTVDVTTMLVFGYDVNTIEQADDVIQRKLELVFPTLNRRLFALLPTWRWLRLPADRRVDRALRELRAWLSERIAEARERVAADAGRAERPQTFLESIIGLRDEHGAPVSDEVIMGNALTMLLAGEDTTAYTLAWAVHHLCDAPVAAAALRAEADAVLRTESVPAELELADRLTYAGAVANEALRLRPVAPFQLYEANHDTLVGDVAVPKGTWVALLTRPPVLDERNFHDPTAFRPERWLADQRDLAHEPGAHMPFGSGPRICPGRSLALLEMRVVLALLYKEFDVERAGSATPVREQFAFTMAPTALRLRLRRRH